ncbi:unnamed protein product, partial [Closterium sp. NIES-53]
MGPRQSWFRHLRIFSLYLSHPQQADVVVVTMRAWEDVVGDEDGPEAELARQGAMEAFTRARTNIAAMMEADAQMPHGSH